VPNSFAIGLDRLLRQFTNSTTSGTVSSAGVNDQTQQQNEQSISKPSRVHERSMGSTSDSNDINRSQATQNQVTSLGVSVRHSTPRRVLLIVKSGTDHHLTQMLVHEITSLGFFKKLRSEYFRLRGFWRSRLSVWRYSHCDFYKVSQAYNLNFENLLLIYIQCEKFDEHDYAPRQKDQYPDLSNEDYTYRPKPINDMPPISEHEFHKRFYSSNPFKLFHGHPFHRYSKYKCNKVNRKGHCREILELLPKKLSQLDESSDQREFFWGIYAREVVCLRWVLFYNIICMLPLMWFFFFMWIFQWGHTSDLQDASMPITMMIGLLSVFWSVFLGSLQFGKSSEAVRPS
jgi:hypothetical protein